jgi:hypothetical protein
MDKENNFGKGWPEFIAYVCSKSSSLPSKDDVIYACKGTQSRQSSV